MFQLGPQLDVNALVDRMFGAGAVMLLAGSLFLFMVARVVAAWRAPKNAKTLGDAVASAFEPLAASLKIAIEQQGNQERDAKLERDRLVGVLAANNAAIASNNQVLNRMEDWQETSVQRHKDYTATLITAFADIVKGIVSSLNATSDALTLEVKALRVALDEVARINREHTTSTFQPIQAGLTLATQGVGAMQDEIKSLNAKLDDRAERNGQSFQSIQSSIDEIKEELAKLKPELLAKFDDLIRQMKMREALPAPAPEVKKDFQPSAFQAKEGEDKGLHPK